MIILCIYVSISDVTVVVCVVVVTVVVVAVSVVVVVVVVVVGCLLWFSLSLFLWLLLLCCCCFCCFVFRWSVRVSFDRHQPTCATWVWTRKGWGRNRSADNNKYYYGTASSRSGGCTPDGAEADGRNDEGGCSSGVIMQSSSTRRHLTTVCYMDETLAGGRCSEGEGALHAKLPLHVRRLWHRQSVYNLKAVTYPVAREQYAIHLNFIARHLLIRQSK